MRYYYGNAAKEIVANSLGSVQSAAAVWRSRDKVIKGHPNADIIQVPVCARPSPDFSPVPYYGSLWNNVITFKYMPYKSTGEKRWCLEWGAK